MHLTALLFELLFFQRNSDTLPTLFSPLSQLPLSSISTGAIASDEVVLEMKQAKYLEECAFKPFIPARLTKPISKFFFDSVKK